MLIHYSHGMQVSNFHRQPLSELRCLMRLIALLVEAILAKSRLEPAQIPSLLQKANPIPHPQSQRAHLVAALC